MPSVNIAIRGQKAAAPSRKSLSSPTPSDGRYGFEGMVTELHPENNTVHVRTPEGRIISNVKVASHVWVTIDEDKGYLSGERKLPPIDTYVLVFMPNGEYSSAIIIASVFSSDPQHGDFKEDSDDAKEINDSVENSGWKYTEDKRTGTRVLQNKPEDPTIKIEVDQEKKDDEKVTITIHGNIFTVDKDNGLQVKTDKNIKGEIEGDYKTAIKGKASINADGEIVVKSNKGEKLDIGNMVDNLGGILDALFESLMRLHSEGSPTNHTVASWAASDIAPLKIRASKVFKK